MATSAITLVTIIEQHYYRNNLALLDKSHYIPISII